MPFITIPVNINLWNISGTHVYYMLIAVAMWECICMKRNTCGF